jgi:hypothetical protein
MNEKTIHNKEYYNLANATRTFAGQEYAGRSKDYDYEKTTAKTIRIKRISAYNTHTRTRAHTHAHTRTHARTHAHTHTHTHNAC